MTEAAKPGEPSPIVFVSYCHETPEHKNWVKTLASDLRKNGVQALLDVWQVEFGGDFPLFMEKIRTSDRVLLVCTPVYARKANEGEGGVGYERSVVTAELAQRIDTTKFICVLRQGDDKDAIPIFATGRRYIDFRNDSEYDVRLEDLLRAVHNAPRDPEPPLGPNPFAKRGTDQTYESPAPPSERRSYSVEAMIEQAAVLLANKNMFGWKRLLGAARRDFEKRITEWRNALPPQDLPKDGWRNAMDRGVQLCEPLFALALSAIHSEIESVRDQTGMLDVILSLENWPRGGYVCVIKMPRAIAFLYHELVGSYYMHSRQHTEAIRLLRSQVGDVDSSRLKPIHSDHELMGYVTSLDGNYVTSWKYFIEYNSSRGWLREFFPAKRDYLNSYRAYNLLASIIELGTFLGQGGNVKTLKDNNPILYVPPMFLNPIDEHGASVEMILNLAIPSSATLLEIAQVTQCDVKVLRDAWASWYKCLVRELSVGYWMLADDLSAAPVPALPG